MKMMMKWYHFAAIWSLLVSLDHVITFYLLQYRYIELNPFVHFTGYAVWTPLALALVWLYTYFVVKIPYGKHILYTFIALNTLPFWNDVYESVIYR